MDEKSLIATAACLAVLALGTSAARAFDVSGLSFTDFHSTSSPHESSYHSHDNGNDSSHAAAPPRETFHPETPEERAARDRENAARYRQSLALLLPAPGASAAPVAPAGPAEAMQPSGPGYFNLSGGSSAVEIPWDELQAVHVAATTLATQATADFQAYAPARQPLQIIGAIGAARGEITITSKDGKTRKGGIGKPVFHDDHVSTGPNARLQVVLADGSVFTVGPDSDIVLDDFVYDPNTSAGSVAASLTKGVFRFVTGKVARQSPTNMKVRIPTAELGPRGTEFEVLLDPASGNGYAKLYYGGLEIKDDRMGAPIELDSGQMVAFTQAGGYTAPEPLDADASPAKIDAAKRAMYLLRAASTFKGSDDDKEFLDQVAGLAMERQPVPLEIPTQLDSLAGDARLFHSEQQDIEGKIAAYVHFRRIREWIEDANGDATDALRQEQAAQAEVKVAWETRQTLIDNM